MYIRYKSKNCKSDIYVYKITNDMGGVTCVKHPDGKLDNIPKSSNWMFNINNKEMLYSKYFVDILTKDELFLELV